MNSASLSSGSGSSNDSSSASSDSGSHQSDSRRTVADILSSMANGEMVTPSTLAALDGFTTGIPTRTTPTLTPTTLRNIEQTFIELQSVPPPNSHHHQAGFVPPVVNSTSSSVSSQISSTTASSYQPILKEEALWYTSASPPPRTASSSSSSGRGHGSTKSSGRMGGRRPRRDERLSPEEEERRRVRRERNKLAAARCRKRRLDHTNTLLNETDGLEEKRQELQKEIGELQSQKDHLEFILEAHRCLCKGENNGNGKMQLNSQTVSHLKDVMAAASSSGTIATSTSTSSTMSYSDGASSKPLSRPTSLQLPSNFTVPTSTNLRLNSSVSVSEVAGVPISTPSNGMFNFDALMDGGTGLTPMSSGLTPIVPTCSSQQRNPNNDVMSPDNFNPPKLVSL